MATLLVVLMAVLLVGPPGCGRRLRDGPDARAFHARALVADLHSDSVLRMVRGFDFTYRDSTGHMDIPRLIEGGVDLQAFACWLSTHTPLEKCQAKVDEMLDSLDAQIGRNPDRIAVCLTAADAERIIASGRIAAFLAMFLMIEIRLRTVYPGRSFISPTSAFSISITVSWSLTLSAIINAL